MDTEALERLHQAMADRVASGALPGIVTVVARGEDAHVDAIGATAFEGGTALGRDAIFRVASLTKPILAAATMALVEDGVLALDQPVDALLPELAGRRVLRALDGPLHDTEPARRPITVEDLLTFRMGHGQLFEPTFDPPFPIVRAGEDLELALGPPDPRTPHAPDAWIERFATLPLMHQPGRLWQYNTAALVLGVLVARAGGAPLEAVLRTRVLAPLGMTDTGFSTSAEQAHRLPTQYATDFETGRVHENTLSRPEVWTRPPAFPSGAGGLLSTASDYLAFARMLMNRGAHQGRRVLSERSVELMTTNHLTPEQIEGGGIFLSGAGWGFGMAVTVAPDDVSPPGRYGWAGGYGTTWFNDPGREVIGIALTQTDAFMFNGSLPEFEKLAARV